MDSIGEDDPALSVVARAISEGDAATVRNLCAHVDLNRSRLDGITLLNLAVEHDREAVVALLISLGADVNLEDEPSGFTPLARALDLMRDMSTWTTPSDRTVRLLLEHGADPDQPCFGGELIPMKMASGPELKARGIDLNPLLARYRRR